MHIEADKLSRARRMLETIYVLHDQVVLCFSGGKDSLVLAELCRPWRERTTLVWTNTGFMFPHMTAFIRDFGTRWGRYHEVKTDLMEEWKRGGLPSSIVPTEHSVEATRKPREPKIQPWLSCCARGRSLPGIEWFLSHADFTGELTGQREQDNNPAIQRVMFHPNGKATYCPLWDWTENEVFIYLAECGVQLPFHYAIEPESLECWCCPKLTPGRVAFMQEFYPAEAAVALEHARRVKASLLGAMTESFGFIDGPPGA